ncbi:hypothetical protein CSHISOI_00081, partial [Colletotrichum shisoi]
IAENQTVGLVAVQFRVGLGLGGKPIIYLPRRRPQAARPEALVAQSRFPLRGARVRRRESADGSVDDGEGEVGLSGPSRGRGGGGGGGG